MKQYRDLVARILMEGEPREWRNGHTGLGCFDHQMKFDLRQEFPALTLKFLPWKQVIGELVGFLRGYTSADSFRHLGCTIWDQNANEEPAWLANPLRKGTDDLGRIYGAQWRNTQEHRVIPTSDLYNSEKAKFFYEKGYRHTAEAPGQLVISREIDQLQDLLYGIMNDPHGRRHVVSAWNPADLTAMALPPCHMFFQCWASRDGYLDLKMYQRSADVFLGVPFNIASYAALLHLLALSTGRHARYLTMDLGDVHLYTNTIELSHEMLTRGDLPAPQLEFSEHIQQYVGRYDVVDHVGVDDLKLIGYKSHGKLSAEMAV